MLLVKVRCDAASLRDVYCNVYYRIRYLFLLFVVGFVLEAGHVVVVGAPNSLPQLTIYSCGGPQADMPATAKSL